VFRCILLYRLFHHHHVVPGWRTAGADVWYAWVHATPVPAVTWTSGFGSPRTIRASPDRPLLGRLRRPCGGMISPVTGAFGTSPTGGWALFFCLLYLPFLLPGRRSRCWRNGTSCLDALDGFSLSRMLHSTAACAYYRIAHATTLPPTCTPAVAILFTHHTIVVPLPLDASFFRLGGTRCSSLPAGRWALLRGDHAWLRTDKRVTGCVGRDFASLLRTLATTCDASVIAECVSVLNGAACWRGGFIALLALRLGGRTANTVGAAVAAPWPGRLVCGSRN